MPESVVEIVRVCIGFFLVIFGYIASIKERYLGMPLIGAREQPTGIINGFVATLGGVSNIWIYSFYKRKIFRYAAYWCEGATNRYNQWICCNTWWCTFNIDKCAEIFPILVRGSNQQV